MTTFLIVTFWIYFIYSEVIPAKLAHKARVEEDKKDTNKKYSINESLRKLTRKIKKKDRKNKYTNLKVK